MPRFLPALGFLAFAVTVAVAQAPPAGKPEKTEKPEKPAKVEKPAPLKKSPLDNIEGYKRHVIEGFTVLVNKEVLDADVEKYERKPLEVLELELKMVVTVLPPKTVDLFRRLTLWVEWDEVVTPTNSRAGRPVAIYYGGNQYSLLAEGKQPLKAKTVTVLSMRSLTEEHQPKTDSGRCVLMHELAHVVHDQLVGRDNPNIQAAFQQAMQRRLYDRDAYLCTNDAEFFAELTNAYFDQLGYFPNTREQLKAHDPVSFQVIDAVWGTGKKSPNAAKKPDPKGARPAENNDNPVSLADVAFGQNAYGPEVSRDAFDKQVVLVAAWGRGDAPLLGKLAQAAAELGHYGVKVVAVRTIVEERVEKATEEMRLRKVEFTVVDGAGVKDKRAPQGAPLDPGQAIVFGPDGKSVFRGSGYDAL
ncbi:MAG: anthrax toxin lethal factor-related metalloendopeptidase, partial [Fimbriiglobus sp.]